MDDILKSFDDFDRGRISRRRLLELVAIALATRPTLAFAQGSCGGARAGTPECNPTPAKLPFEPTGWRTVLLDHFSVHVADYKKEAAYYAALHLPTEADQFIGSLQQQLTAALTALDADLPTNPHVTITAKGRLKVAALTAQPEPPTLGRVKGEVACPWRGRRGGENGSHRHLRREDQ